MNCQKHINLLLWLPFCKDEEKYVVVENLSRIVKKLKNENIKIDNQIITNNIDYQRC